MGKFLKNYITIQPHVFLLLSMLLLLIPLPWSVCWIIAATVHELCHAAAVFLCGKKVRYMSVSAFGIVLKTEELEDIHQIVCAAAGPCSGLLISQFAQKFPRLAVCGFVQGVYNLLPICPLDGSIILASAFRIFFGKRIGDRLTEIADYLARIMIVILGIYVAVAYDYVALPVIMAAVIALRKREKKNFLQRCG